jgi:thiamine-phosphate pyrophosphorylase
LLTVVGHVTVSTDRTQVQPGRDLVEVIRAAVDGGATHVVLREKDLLAAERSELAHQVAEALDASASERLVIASDLRLAAAVGAAGVHLAARDPWPAANELEVGDRRLLLGRSCHSETELREARDRGADYATISPVFPTSSKPGYGPALGTDGLARLCGAVLGLPVIALGGIGPGRVAPCLAAGAAGVAAMGEVMRSDDPGAVVALLVAEAG